MPTKPRTKATARAKKTPTRKAVIKSKAAATPKTEKTAKTAKPTKRAKHGAATASALATVGPRRAVFIDVENTSSESELARVLDELAIDLTTGATDVTAIGNWRVVGQQLGRSLAQRGAHLVHSAPATRVPDWSDLWIAVQAGIWLGRSRPGDVIDIVSHDRAFDAVGDAAARLGVRFNRITYRSAGPSVAASESTSERRPRRRRRRGGAGRASGPSHESSQRHSPAPAAHATAAARHEEEPHGASQEQIQHVIARLAANDPTHTVTLDALTVALKAAGFQRPPGSPRLVTRLRRMKDIEVLPNGKVRMAASSAAVVSEAHAEPLAEPAGDDADVVDGAGENGAAGGEAGAKRRSRRRGGRRRGGRGRKAAATAPAAPSE
jgi:hypothetical protein